MCWFLKRSTDEGVIGAIILDCIVPKQRGFSLEGSYPFSPPGMNISNSCELMFPALEDEKNICCDLIYFVSHEPYQCIKASFKW